MSSPFLTIVMAAFTAYTPAPSDDASAVDFFEKKVRPVLVGNCTTCHSAETNAKGGLRVDDRNGLIHGGGSGPAIVPGKPDESLLIQAIRHSDDAPKMPPKKKLTDDQIADLSKWITDGAAWPKVEGSPSAASRPNARYETLRKEHWAWQPLKEATPPVVRLESWPRTDIDRFVLAKLEQTGLSPVADADRATLIRRLSFDLTGLPPTPDEISSFLLDSAPDAYEKLVDRLLASPAFGERWGRHWLDVARFGESTGSSRNLPYPHAWRYRDYVIDSLNKDKPFDQFLREQVAGDLLPASSTQERDEHRVATGFLAVGVKDVNQRFKVRFVMDNVDEQIDAVSRSTLAMTVACARCHDHKFDPIPQKDYYALAGIFQSSDLCAGLKNKMGGGGLDYYDPSLLLTLGDAKTESTASAEKVEAAKKALAEARTEFQKLRDTPEGAEKAEDGRPKRAVARQKMNRLQNELTKLTDPAANGIPLAMGVRDAAKPADTEIRIRGEAEKLGPVVPRGFLSVVSVPGSASVNPSQSGRLELAHWITSPANPLTPRVFANRVWAHLFGRGIVTSVDNFGSTGDTPSHPELLDHLAGSFVRDGWSVKWLVRSIVLTRTYRLGPEATPAGTAIDPENRLVWRHSPRRLEAEEIRDATLAVVGALDTSRPTGSVARDLKVTELRNNGPEAAKFAEQARASRHRSVYLPLLRGMVPTSLEVFDFAEQGMVTGRRDATTVAHQALYMLNDPFVRRRALDLAETLLAKDSSDDAERIGTAYRVALARSPTPDETKRVSAFLSEYEAAARESLAAGPDPSEKEIEVVTTVPAETTGTTDAGKPEKKPMPPINPDEVVASEVVAKEDVIRPKDARSAAWAAFIQSLFGSAEFRYVK